MVTPPAIGTKLQDQFVRIARMSDIIARIKPLSIDSVDNTSDEFTRIVTSDIESWAAVARAASVLLSH